MWCYLDPDSDIQNYKAEPLAVGNLTTSWSIDLTWYPRDIISIRALEPHIGMSSYTVPITSISNLTRVNQ